MGGILPHGSFTLNSGLSYGDAPTYFTMTALPFPFQDQEGIFVCTPWRQGRALGISHPPPHSKIKASRDKFFRFVVKLASLFSAFSFHMTITGAFSNFNCKDYIILASRTCFLIFVCLNISFILVSSFIILNISTMFIVLSSNCIIWHLKTWILNTGNLSLFVF